MADRVAVLRSGVLQQVGPPSEIYDEPANLFVSGFIGRCNVLRVEARQGSHEFVVDGHVWKGRQPAGRSGLMTAAFRPERVQVGPAPENSAPVEILEVQRTVHGISVTGKLGENLIEIQPGVQVAGSADWRPGSRVVVHVPAEAIHLFPHEQPDPSP